MLFKTFLIALFPLIAFASKDLDFLHSIHRAVNGLKARQPSAPPKEVCYPDIGCFSTDGPLKHLGTLPATPEQIGTKFFLFTTKSPSTPQEVNPKDAKSLELIDATKPFAVVSHGFSMDSKEKQLSSVKDSLIKFGHLETVIMVDWAKGAKSPEYVEAATNTQVVGRQVAFLVETLRTKRSVDPKNVHLIGFSLGAQVSGFAGKYSQTTYKWKFGRISALDSAAPLFEGYPGAFLNQDDAIYVDAIHTSAGHVIVTGEVGFIEPIGHVDFFPHNGTHQPRCSGKIDLTCNHRSSVLYFESSLSGGAHCLFTAYKCPNYQDFEDKKCAKGGDSRLGFYSTTQPGRGVHYLDCAKDYPFCTQ